MTKFQLLLACTWLLGSIHESVGNLDAFLKLFSTLLCEILVPIFSFLDFWQQIRRLHINFGSEYFGFGAAQLAQMNNMLSYTQ
jgi:hypothetical protein